LWTFEKLEEDPLFSINILFSDEAYFWPNSYVNKQIYYIWAEEQLKEVQYLLLHSDKTMVWYGLWLSGIIDLYFFNNEASYNVIVNGTRYRTIIRDYCL